MKPPTSPCCLPGPLLPQKVKACSRLVVKIKGLLNQRLVSWVKKALTRECFPCFLVLLCFQVPCQQTALENPIRMIILLTRDFQPNQERISRSRPYLCALDQMHTHTCTHYTSHNTHPPLPHTHTHTPPWSRCTASHWVQCQWDYMATGIQYEILAGPAFTLIFTIAAIPLGVLAGYRRVNRKIAIAVCLVLWSTMTLLAGFTLTFWQLLLTRVGLGIL